MEHSRLSDAQIASLLQRRPVRVVEGGAIMTGPVRLSFPSLDKKTGIAGGVQKYNATGLFTHKNIGPLHQALVAAVRQNYPNVTDPSVMLDPFNKNHPLKDQALKVSTNDGGRDPIRKSLAGYTVGLPYINPKSGNAVPCFQAVAGQWKSVMPEEIKDVFYAGCWVEMKLTIFKSTASANPGVALGLQGVWKLADDETFGGGGGGASADEGGSADDAVSIEDPNAALGAPGGGWGGNTAQPEASAWD